MDSYICPCCSDSLYRKEDPFVERGCLLGYVDLVCCDSCGYENWLESYLRIIKIMLKISFKLDKELGGILPTRGSEYSAGIVV